MRLTGSLVSAYLRGKTPPVIAVKVKISALPLIRWGQTDSRGTTMTNDWYTNDEYFNHGVTFLQVLGFDVSPAYPSFCLTANTRLRQQSWVSVVITRLCCGHIHRLWTHTQSHNEKKRQISELVPPIRWPKSASAQHHCGTFRRAWLSATYCHTLIIREGLSQESCQLRYIRLLRLIKKTNIRQRKNHAALCFSCPVCP